MTLNDITLRGVQLFKFNWHNEPGKPYKVWKFEKKAKGNKKKKKKY